MNKPCPKGKVRNPETGRCIDKNSPRLISKPQNTPQSNNQKKVIMNLQLSVDGVNFKAAPNGKENRQKIMEWHYKLVIVELLIMILKIF